MPKAKEALSEFYHKILNENPNVFRWFSFDFWKMNLKKNLSSICSSIFLEFSRLTYFQGFPSIFWSALPMTVYLLGSLSMQFRFNRSMPRLFEKLEWKEMRNVYLEQKISNKKTNETLLPYCDLRRNSRTSNDIYLLIDWRQHECFAFEICTNIVVNVVREYKIRMRNHIPIFLHRFPVCTRAIIILNKSWLAAPVKEMSPQFIVQSNLVKRCRTKKHQLWLQTENLWTDVST